MKKLYFFLLAICFIGTACENKEPQDKDIIAVNLLKQGTADQTLLVGYWDCMEFAYTKDGNKIKNVKNISGLGISKKMLIEENFYAWYMVRIGDLDTGLIELYKDTHQGLSNFLSFGAHTCYYSISGYLMENSKIGYIYFIKLPITDEVLDVRLALENTYSFVIRGDELIIHFTGVKNRNLLILKKREL